MQVEVEISDTLFVWYSWWPTDPKSEEIMGKSFIRHDLLITPEDEYQNLLFRIWDAEYAQCLNGH